MPAVVQVAGGGEPVATVVARPAQDQDAPGIGEAVAERVHHTGGRVFHENEARHAEILDRVSIRLAHGLIVENGQHGDLLDLLNGIVPLARNH